MRKAIKVSGTIILIGLFIIFLLYFLTISGLIFVFYPSPGVPEIKYGEFPFKLVYEVAGEVRVIEDTIICEYDGYIHRGAAGKERKWKTSLKSGEEFLILCDLSSLGNFDEAELPDTEWYFSYGTAAYYMGDKANWDARGAQGFKVIYYVYTKEDGTKETGSMKAEDAWEKYKIKLISWTVTPPSIQNTFND